MKRMLLAMNISLISTIVLATPVTLQHSKTSYVNSGICSAVVDVTIHDSLGTYDKLYLDLVVNNRAGKVEGTSEDVISYEDVENTSGRSFGRIFIESESMCEADSNWAIQVKRAVLIVDGKREDLIKTEKIQIDDFQPMKLKVN